MQSTMTRISTAAVYTTLATTDIDRAEKFFRDTLGFDTERQQGSPASLTVRAGKGTGLSVYERPTPPSCDTTAATFVCEDLDGAMSDLRDRGVSFEDYDLPYLKTENGVATQGSTRASWFRDPDGNVLSLVEM